MKKYLFTVLFGLIPYLTFANQVNSIEGPSVLCDSAFYSLNNVPNGATIIWSYVGYNGITNGGTPFYILSGQGTDCAKYARGSQLKNEFDFPGDPELPFPGIRNINDAETMALVRVPYEGDGTIKVSVILNGDTTTLTKQVYMPETVKINDLGLGLTNSWVAGTRKVFTLDAPTKTEVHPHIKWEVSMSGNGIIGSSSFTTYGSYVAVTPSLNVSTVSITATNTYGCDTDADYCTLIIPVIPPQHASFSNPASGNVEISIIGSNNLDENSSMRAIDATSELYMGAYRLELWHDLYGKVREIDAAENTPTVTMNLDGLNSGIYLLRLIIDGQIIQVSQMIVK